MKKNPSNSGPKRRYTQDFKEDAARLVVERGQKPADVARNLGISPASLSRWVRRYLAIEDDDNGAGRTAAQVHQENIELRKELRKANQQREILKKALEIFSQESNPTSSSS